MKKYCKFELTIKALKYNRIFLFININENNCFYSDLDISAEKSAFMSLDAW